MLQIHDIRESRAYQDARDEGVKEGIEKGFEKGVEKGIEKGVEKGIAMAIARMAARNMPAAEIAAILQLDVETVQRTLATAQAN